MKVHICKCTGRSRGGGRCVREDVFRCGGLLDDGWTMVGRWVRPGYHLRDHYCATSLSYCDGQMHIQFLELPCPFVCCTAWANALKAWSQKSYYKLGTVGPPKLLVRASSLNWAQSWKIVRQWHLKIGQYQCFSLSLVHQRNSNSALGGVRHLSSHSGSRPWADHCVLVCHAGGGATIPNQNYVLLYNQPHKTYHCTKFCHTVKHYTMR